MTAFSHPSGALSRRDFFRPLEIFQKFLGSNFIFCFTNGADCIIIGK